MWCGRQRSLVTNVSLMKIMEEGRRLQRRKGEGEGGREGGEGGGGEGGRGEKGRRGLNLQRFSFDLVAIMVVKIAP